MGIIIGHWQFQNIETMTTDEQLILKEIGLKSGQFFIEIMDMDGLGWCGSEEELDVLYSALCGEDIEENLEN